ncbi:MAG: transglutaminase domain-containing protein [Candidatus Hydrogenedentes bacterium]|nr:transglutaminase domain-containing protein [Candidatus Hydrogenedentota bacterium]
MTRRIVALFFFLLAPAALSQPIDIAAYLGESWYGVYMNDQKAGYAVNKVEQNDDGSVSVIENMRFQINMAGVKQDMRIEATRTYAADGALLSIVSEVVDPAGSNRFNGVVRGDELHLKTVIGGAESEGVHPKPRESLQDAMKLAQLVSGDAKVGAAIEFTTFEPMYRKEITGISTIVAVEEREMQGVHTKVFKISTELREMGVNSVSYVTEDGVTLEDEVAGLIKLRLEDEQLARDVSYSNDVIAGNAALVETPIQDARKRNSLALEMRGPLSDAHVFNDERQTVTPADGYYRFEGRRYDMKGFKPAPLPITDEALAPWIEATQFVQSDHPKLIEKAKSIIDEATASGALKDASDSLAVSKLLCEWVYKNMNSTFSARLTNAIEVLEHLEGDCTEHSILFIGLARAAGLPAREVAGLVYVEGVQPGFYFHQWAKVWVGKWIDVDPTFNQPLVDATHIKLAEGDLFQQARIIPIIGQLQIREAEDQ